MKQMRKRLLSLTLSLTLGAGLLTTGALAAYRDTDDPNAAALAERGLMNGAGEGFFDPDAPMTRAMLSAVLFRLAGEDPADYAGSPLADVPAESWYGPAAFWAWQTGLLGEAGLAFGPERAVTRGELLAALCRYTGDFASAPEAWGAALAAGVEVPAEGALTRLQAAALLRRFADADPARPLTMGAVVDASPSAAREAARYGGFSYTWEQTFYEDGRAARTETQRVSLLSDGGDDLVELYTEPGGTRSVYRGDRAYAADGETSGVVCQSPALCRALVDFYSGTGLLAYSPTERITGVERTGEAVTVTTRDTHEGGCSEYVYTLDARSLETLRLSEADYDGSGTCYRTGVTTPSFRAPVIDTAFMDGLSAAEGGPTRTCTLVTDPGLAGEAAETYTVPEGRAFYYVDRPGYRFFQDAAGTRPVDWGVEPHGDVTMYLVADPTVQEVISANAAASVLKDRGVYGWTVARTDLATGEEGSYAYTLAPRGERYDIWRTALNGGSQYFYLDGRAAVLDPDGGTRLLCLPPALYDSTLKGVAYGPLGYSDREETVDVDVSDGRYVVVTEARDGDGGLERCTYTADLGTLLLRSMVSVTTDAEGNGLKRTEITYAYDQTFPESAAIRALLEAPAGADSRRLTLVFDPGTEGEARYFFTAPQGTYFALPVVKGYAYYLDAACTQPRPAGDSGQSAEGDVTLYLSKAGGD